MWALLEIGRNHEHKLGFRRDRGCHFRNGSDLRVADAGELLILAVESSVNLGGAGG